MKLTTSQMKYMMALGRLDHGKKIRCTDIASTLKVKKPSVCGMMCKLEALGLVSQDPYSDVRITEEGEKVIRECNESYGILMNIVKERLEVSDGTAEAITCLLMSNLTSGSLEELLVSK